MGFCGHSLYNFCESKITFIKERNQFEKKTPPIGE